MITQVSGTVARVGVDWVDVDLGGVCLRVNAPASAMATVGDPGTKVRLFTSLQVREDSLTLYGFSSDDGRSTFESLLGITGVGPRLALAVLSMFTPQDLAVAVATADVDSFARVPGVGKKTASRMILELKGRLSKELEVVGGGEDTQDLIAALTALGYSLGEAREAVSTLPPGADLSLEDRVRAALERLAGE